MTPLARGFSFVYYSYVSGDRIFAVPFPYLLKEHVRVFIGPPNDYVQASFTWDGPNTIRVEPTALPMGAPVTVRRFTPRDSLMVDFQDGASLPASDLNTDSRQIFYIVQEQIDFGTYGASGLPGGGWTWPNQNGEPPSVPIQEIIDQLMQSSIFQELTGAIGDTSQLAQTTLDDIMGRVTLLDYKHLTEKNTAIFKHEITKNITDIEASVQDLTQLHADVQGNSADIVDVQQAVVDEASARTLAIEASESQFLDDLDEPSSALNSHLSTTYATKDYAESAAETQVSAFAGGSFASLNERFVALVDGTADPAETPAWSANWSVKIEAGKVDGNPVIGGIGLGADPDTGSSFTVMADRFAVISPSYTDAAGVQQFKYPFVIGQVGGVSTVGIQGQLMVDGSISADKIKTNTLSALSANMGEVNGGTFRTFNLDENGAIIDPLELRAEMTNKSTDSFPIWVGAGVKNANNAVFYVDRAGNASFDGKVSASNLVDNLQVNTTFAWEGDINAMTGGSPPTFTLPAPVRPGATHRPLALIELSLQGTDDDGQAAADGIIRLQKLSGATWVDVRASQYGVYKFTLNSSSLIVGDEPTSTATTYRIYVGDGHTDFHLRHASGYIFGLR